MKAKDKRNNEQGTRNDEGRRKGMFKGQGIEIIDIQGLAF